VSLSDTLQIEES